MSHLEQLIAAHSLTLPNDFIEKVGHYKALLEKWNKVHNLTGAKTLQQIDQFILDAILPVSFLPPLKKAMDIGTGAGFPGMILALALPQTHFTLVEPLRVEQLVSEPYDLITSRAVTDTEMLLKLSKPFCTEGTLLLFYKGEKVYDEIDETLDYKIIEAENRHYLLIKR
jgi:16S rRNA (guanine527-N7)-methyltransferase